MLKNLIFFILISYTGLVLFAYFFADRIIFPKPPSTYGDAEDIIKIITIDGKNIAALFLPNPNAEYTILYSHGNYKDIGTIRHWLKSMQQQGFAVFAYDFHGYGISEGQPSEQNVYYDINAAYDYLTNKLKIKPERIVVFGFSLGAALAIDLATRKKVAAIIAQSPFLSAYRTITRIPLLPLDKFNNLAKIKKIYVPILIIHGTKDDIIPFWHGRELYDAAILPKYYYWIDGAGHNDLMDVAGEKYWQTIKDFVAKIY
jgi:abhydrolase domain-containing protein 17